MTATTRFGSLAILITTTVTLGGAPAALAGDSQDTGGDSDSVASQ